MKKVKKNLNRSSSVSASILSMGLSLLSFSKVELNQWWHFILGGVIIFAFYGLFFFSIEGLMGIYEKYVKRADISVDSETEIRELGNYIDAIYEKDKRNENPIADIYKSILSAELVVLYNKAIKKISFIEHFTKSPSIKTKIEIFDEELFKNYKEYCNYIKHKYKF